MIGRVIVGLGVGVASMIVPIYISEISPSSIRGKLIAVNETMIATGLFVASCFAFALGTNWRLMLGLAAVPSIT